MGLSAQAANFAALAALFLALPMLRGGELPAPLTLDLPLAANIATPAWLGHPVTPANTFATLTLPIFPPDVNASLLVTVYFQEKNGGLMRVTWSGLQGAVTLADNFYEDIGMANQRTLLIAPSTLAGDGKLSFQTGDTTLGIARVHFEWIQPQEELVSPEVREELVTPAKGATVAASSANGAPSAALEPAWDNEVVTVPITDSPVRVEQGVAFSVDLDKVPNGARVSLKESGLPLGQHLAVWVNDKRAGSITPAVPDLTDGGFFASDKSSSYVGWRNGSFYVPVSTLLQGENTITFSAEDDAGAASTTAAATAAPLAVKDLDIQLDYTAPAPVSDTPTLHLSATLSPTP